MKIIEIFWTFLKLGLSSFGGPVAHLAYFHREFVEQKKWLTDSQYAQLLIICQTIPGPASSQVGFAIGLLRDGWLGAIFAFIAFTLPSVVLLIGFANSLHFFNSDVGIAALDGLATVAFIVVLQAIVGMGKTILQPRLSWLIAAAMFCIVLMLDALNWQLFALLLCAVVGCILLQEDEQAINNTRLNSCALPYRLTLSTTAISVSLFIAILWSLTKHPFNAESLIYTHASAYYTSGAMVFGGGHVVLPFLEQATVATGLVSQDTFLAGYGATQALPGPMFSFAAYLGYMTEVSQSTVDGNNHMLSAISSALLATLFIFLPGFLLLSAILPVSQTLFVHSFVRRGFMGANAGVLGLLAATLYDPIFTHAINGNLDLTIAALGYVALSKFKAPVLVIVVFCVCAKVCAIYLLE